jgi:hypothetical protein
VRLLIFWIMIALATATNATSNETENVVLPVYEGNTDKPYVVVGEIKDNLRKPFAFMASPTKAKIYAEIWERARKMGADAVINARFGETQRTMFDHGRTPISGTAIKYTDSVVPSD